MIQQQEIFDQLFRIIFLGLSPVIVIVFVASLLSSVIQSSLAIKNESLDLVSRLLALIVALYFFFPELSVQ